MRADFFFLFFSNWKSLFFFFSCVFVKIRCMAFRIEEKLNKRLIDRVTSCRRLIKQNCGLQMDFTTLTKMRYSTVLKCMNAAQIRYLRVRLL